VDPKHMSDWLVLTGYQAQLTTIQ